MEQGPEVLVVDDVEQNILVLEKLLRLLHVTVVPARSGEQALRLARGRDFALAIVDVQMPGMDGYELVRLLREEQNTATLPVIFVSAIYADEFHFQKGYDAGAVDFITKPFVPQMLLSKVRVFLDLYSQRRRLQFLVDELNEVNAVLSKQAAQLETSSEVGQRVTSILDLDALLPQVTGLIQARFDYYAVGAWLINEGRDAAQLAAFSCRLPESPFLRGHALPLDLERSIIARVCCTAEIYLANEVQVDPHYLPAEHLPDTRSELTLPLRSGAQLIGALDFQSDEPHAFGPEDVTALRVLADQIAVAIRNAQLYSQVVRFNEQLESRVRERTAQLEHAYRQLELLDENKADFIRVMSHELRTPLTLVKGYAQMLIDDRVLAADDSANEMILGIASGAQRLHDLVSSMLDMGRIDTGTVPLKFQPILLADLLTALRYDLTVPLQQRRLELTLEHLRGLPAIEGDVAALRKVFEHLLLNAIKYTPDGGRITVTGRCMDDRGADSCERFVELVVSDTGIGIDREFQELVFMKFYQTGQVALHSSGRTKYKGGGPGLGLAIARGMVEAHGGRIWVESPGYSEETCPGSHFHVVLPVHPLPPA